MYMYEAHAQVEAIGWTVIETFADSLLMAYLKVRDMGYKDFYVVAV